MTPIINVQYTRLTISQAHRCSTILRFYLPKNTFLEMNVCLTEFILFQGLQRFCTEHKIKLSKVQKFWKDISFLILSVETVSVYSYISRVHLSSYIVFPFLCATSFLSECLNLHLCFHPSIEQRDMIAINIWNI